ncbi:MAG: hypothetical protein ACTSYS_05005 [Promethearchaeota archaeon]
MEYKNSMKIDVKELIKILPKLIRENDEVKGAILSALSGVVATKEDIKELIKQMDKRFEAMQEQMDKRFDAMQEQMDKRFEAMEKRFEAMDKRFDAMQEQMDKRFEAVDKRFEIIDKKFEAVDKRFDTLESKIDTNYTILRAAIDNIGNRGGKGLEEMVLKLLREHHDLKKVDFKRIERKKIVDAEGFIFPKNYSTDIDILMENGKTILMEIKFKVDLHDIFHFVQVSKLYEHLYHDVDELWVLSLEVTSKTLKDSKKFPIKMIHGVVKDKE